MFGDIAEGWSSGERSILVGIVFSSINALICLEHARLSCSILPSPSRTHFTHTLSRLNTHTPHPAVPTPIPQTLDLKTPWCSGNSSSNKNWTSPTRSEACECLSHTYEPHPSSPHTHARTHTHTQTPYPLHTLWLTRTLNPPHPLAQDQQLGDMRQLVATKTAQHRQSVRPMRNLCGWVGERVGEWVVGG